MTTSWTTSTYSTIPRNITWTTSSTTPGWETYYNGLRYKKYIPPQPTIDWITKVPHEKKIKEMHEEEIFALLEGD